MDKLTKVVCWVVHYNPTIGFALERANEREIELKEWFL